MSDYEYKLTAVVLVYNGEPYLRDCLESLVNQTLDGLEILLINDASTDDSLSICREFEKECDNVKIIDKEKNEGLATSANLGIELAKGEYVILVDNDDIIPEYAYEKLYNKAKETGSDISIGKANFIVGRYQREMDFHDNIVWKEEKIITDVNDYPILFHDAFYWNKIIKKELLMKYNVRLPIGMIYADRNFSHSAYTHANKISIITDSVYLWRRRSNSLSMKREDVSNYINRLDSYELNLDEITSCYKEYIKVLLRRIFVPIDGMLKSKEFEEIFFNRVYNIIQKEESKIDDIYDNNLNDIYNVFLYLLLNKKEDELKKLLQFDYNNCQEIINEGGKSYWNLPLFRNVDVKIPDELFEIHYLQKQFVKIGEILSTDDSIIFNEIEIPMHFPLEYAYIDFRGKTKPNEIYVDNCYSFKLEKLDDDERNIYKVNVPLNQLDIFQEYDIYFKSKSSNRIEQEFKISTDYINDISNNNENIKITTLGKNSLFITTALLENEFEIDYNSNKIIIIPKDNNKIKQLLNIYLINDITKEKTKLTLNEKETAFELEWKFFLDSKSVYSFYITVYDEKGKRKKNIPLTINHLHNFKKSTFPTNINIKVNSYLNDNENIKLNSL